jgi:hypothetical protein
MKWEEVTIPVVHGTDRVSGLLRFSADTINVVEVKVSEDIEARSDGPDLFEALVSVRRDLERSSLLLACNGGRRDVFPSPMLRQAAAGRFAYVLVLPRTQAKPSTVDIFAPAPEGSVLATVAEQRSYFDTWCQSGSENGRVS